MSRTERAIDEFWGWFQTHSADFERLRDPEDQFWDIAVERLQQVDKCLWFEISGPNEVNREIIITAEGNAEAFTVVDAIIARAPRIAGWKFIALKPARGFDFEFGYEGIEFDPASLWFLPLDNTSDPAALGLLIGIPHFQPNIERQAQNAALIILETGLGERSLARDIQHLEVGPLPSSPEDQGFIPLAELPNYIEWRKRRVGGETEDQN